MNYGNLKTLDIANGPGCRVSLFVSGCRLHCKGCHNPEAQSFDYGKKFGSETLVELLRLLGNPHIAGLSILGGEPFEPENRETVLDICKAAKLEYPSKSIWMWSGYLFEDLRVLPVMEYIDVLVDGPFVEKYRDLSLPYMGSPNQRVIDISRSLRLGAAVLWEDPHASLMKKGRFAT